MSLPRFASPAGSPPTRAPTAQRVGLFVAGLAWVILVGAGFRAMVRYSNTPGLAADAPPSLAPATLRLDAQLPTLIVFVHPLCPCSRATLAELLRLVSRCPGRVRTRVLFRSDAALALDWSGNDLWKQAHEIPDAEVELDPEGRTAHSLGVHTSGQALLYAKGGQLLFAGGITATRGHEGENTGANEIVELLEGRRTQPGGTPVFGCPLDPRPTYLKCEPR